MNKPTPSPRFGLFLLAGGLAAAVNYGSRFVFNVFCTYEWSIILAYGMGMLTAFPLMRIWVFNARENACVHQIWRFLTVNLIGMLQTWVISVFLDRWLFPKIGFTFFPEAMAHFMGLTCPIITNYFGHRSFTFRLSAAEKTK